MDERLCLLTVHAHPDDEASKGAGTVAKYHAQGVHTVLVCCTGGDEGDILNPGDGHRRGQGRHRAVRRRELDAVGQGDRLRRSRHARLPRLGHARQRGQQEPRLRSRRPRSTKRWVGSCASSVAPGPKWWSRTTTSRSGIRTRTTCACTKSRWPRSTPPPTRPSSPNSGEPWTVSEDLLHGVVVQAHRVDAREVPRTRPRVAVQHRLVQGPQASTRTAVATATPRPAR